MIVLNVLLVLCSINSLASGVGFHGFKLHGLKDPEPIGSYEKVEDNLIEQLLDHFNPHDNRTWWMDGGGGAFQVEPRFCNPSPGLAAKVPYTFTKDKKQNFFLLYIKFGRERYYENNKWKKTDGPLLIMIGGEWEISTGFLLGGLMYEIATAHGGVMYYTEHRFYGQSRPTWNTSVDSLQYLSVDQALADLAYFIKLKKEESSLKNNPVIVFGGSYAGSMAAWARFKYPHLIQGALASSAPLYAKADFYEYYEVVARSLGRHSEQCVTDVKSAFESVEELMFKKDGPSRLKNYFNLCEEPNVKSPSDLGHLMNALAEVFAEAVQYDDVENGMTKIAALCANMTATHLGSPLQRLAHIIGNSKDCYDMNYQNFIKQYRDISWDIPATDTDLRPWYHQTCTEYGYCQTSNSNKSIFGTLFPLSYCINMCTDLYGDYYNEKLLNSQIRRTNIMYGGQQPDLTNVIFTNGDIDPWHALSVLKDLNVHSPAILINGTSHCRDLYSDSDTDVEDLKKARAKIRKIIGEWISSWKKEENFSQETIGEWISSWQEEENFSQEISSWNEDDE